MKKNIQKFIKDIQSNTSKINPIYGRNFRELLKIIPIVGSFIDANTIGAIQDAILNERLENLEIACGRALSIEDGQELIAEINNINSIFFVILLTHLTEIATQNQQLMTDIGHLLANARKDSKGFTVHHKFRFVTISGPSAVGKDCMLDLILYWKHKTQTQIETLTKFTTRPKRVVDSKYYDFVTNDQFDRLEKSGNIIFPYFKRGYRYGFDRTHLMNAARQDQFLFSVFTHFESQQAHWQFLRDSGITHFSVLLTADKDSLIIRSDERPLAPEDINKRKISIEEDMRFIDENQIFINRYFDLIVKNGDFHAKRDTYNQIVKFVGLPEMVLPLQDQIDHRINTSHSLN